MAIKLGKAQRGRQKVFHVEMMKDYYAETSISDWSKNSIRDCGNVREKVTEGSNKAAVT